MEAEEKAKKKTSLTRFIKSLIKIAVTILCFWYISNKLQWEPTFRSLKEASWPLLFLALVFFVVSKIISSFRLQLYFNNAGLHITWQENLRLYWLGMFYNLFLPGAISGDAYKVIILNKRRGLSYKTGSSAVLLDRASGVLALVTILSVYGLWVLDLLRWKILLISAAAAAIILFYLGLKFFFKTFVSSFWSTFFLGLLVQVAQVISIYCILSSLGIPSQPEWIFIFLISAMVSILPISLGGGLGTREVVFAEGALLFGLMADKAVLISLLFYVLTLLGSLWGIYYQFHDPLKKR